MGARVPRPRHLRLWSIRLLVGLFVRSFVRYADACSDSDFSKSTTRLLAFVGAGGYV